MLLGVVSDTHGHTHNTLDAVRMLESLSVEAVIHCGDIGSIEVAEMFSSWPTHFVLGNCDRDDGVLESAIQESGQNFHGRFGELELEGRKIAFLHSDDERRFRKTVQSQDWDLVCYGHTHQAKCEKIDETIVLNPGALFRARTHTIALVDLPSLAITSVTI